MTDEARAQGEERTAIPKDDTNDVGGVSHVKGLHKDKVPLFDTKGFQWVVAIMLILVTLVLSGSIVLVVVAALMDGSGQWNTAFFTVLIGLFGMLISGLFVFMAFRIDRGARWEAQQVAIEVGKETKSTARERAELVAAKEARKVAAKEARKTTKEVRKAAVNEAREVANEKLNQLKTDLDRIGIRLGG